MWTHILHGNLTGRFRKIGSYLYDWTSFRFSLGFGTLANLFTQLVSWPPV